MALENPVGRGRLIVTFVRAQNLRKVEVLGQSPIIHFRLDNHKDMIKSNVSHHGNHTPIWNFPYVFDLQGDEHSLVIEVHHQGLIGTAFIGKNYVPLQTLATHPGENWYRLTHGNQEESAGDICISSTWEPSVQQQFTQQIVQQPFVQQPPQIVQQPQQYMQQPPQIVQPPQQYMQQQPPQYVQQQQPPQFVQPNIMQNIMQDFKQAFLMEQIRSNQVHKIALQASNNRYLHAEHHKVHFSGFQIDYNSTWTVQHHGQQIALVSAHGKYLCAYGDGRVLADRDEPSHTEKFFIEELGNNVIALRTHHGTYLGADGEGPMVQRGNLGTHEQFKVQVLG